MECVTVGKIGTTWGTTHMRKMNPDGKKRTKTEKRTQMGKKWTQIRKKWTQIGKNKPRWEKGTQMGKSICRQSESSRSQLGKFDPDGKAHMGERPLGRAPTWESAHLGEGVRWENGPTWEKWAQMEKRGPRWAKWIQMGKNEPSWEKWTHMGKMNPNGQNALKWEKFSAKDLLHN